MVCMWNFRVRGGPEDTRPIIEPELIVTSPMVAGVTDLCFLDERSLVASLENGGVVMLQYLNSGKVNVGHVVLATLYLLCILYT